MQYTVQILDPNDATVILLGGRRLTSSHILYTLLIYLGFDFLVSRTGDHNYRRNHARVGRRGLWVVSLIDWSGTPKSDAFFVQQACFSWFIVV